MRAGKFLVIVVATLFVFSEITVARSTTLADRVLSGHLADGSAYRIEVPVRWNHTLLLYSHGYALPHKPYDLKTAIFGDPAVRALLSRGYAVAASAYAYQGWAVQVAFTDQMQILDLVPKRIGSRPNDTIALGYSMGGDVTVGLAQLHPERFAGALSLCGVVAGPTAFVTQAVFGALAAHALIGVPLPNSSVTQFAALTKELDPLLYAAQKSPQGRARLALVAALMHIPGWNAKTLSRPGPEPADVETNQLASLAWVLPYAYLALGDATSRAGGSVVSTGDKNPGTMLAASPEFATVRALYAAAHLSLGRDLQRVRTARQLRADPSAQQYLHWFFDPDGSLKIPMLSVHTLGDDLVPVTTEAQYRALVRRAGNGALLRQTYVARYGHCNFTPAEVVVSVQALQDRIATGRWPDLAPGLLDAQARRLGDLNELFDKQKRYSIEPAFVSHP